MTCGAMISFQSGCSLKYLMKISSSGCQEEPAINTFSSLVNHDGQLFGLFLDLQHAIETGVAGNGDIGKTNLC